MTPICKVFSATMHADREPLGERITKWIADTGAVISLFEPRLSSDNQFHCLSFSLAGVAGEADGGLYFKQRWFHSVAVFATTKAKEREILGDRVTEWMHDRKIRWKDCEIIVLQSSDSEFHCLTWVVLS